LNLAKSREISAIVQEIPKEDTTTFRKGNRQLWLAARYEDDYVKINGKWKFKHLRAFGPMAAPYGEGWASRAKVDVFSN
jgi:hypothetical protein